MWDKFKNTFMEWISSILDSAKNLIKVGIVGILLLFLLLMYPIICFWILKQTMPGFGFLTYVGGLFLFVGIIFTLTLILSTFRNMFYQGIKDWGVKTNDKVGPIPTIKEITAFLIIAFLSIISGALLMILEIFIKSR